MPPPTAGRASSPSPRSRAPFLVLRSPSSRRGDVDRGRSAGPRGGYPLGVSVRLVLRTTAAALVAACSLAMTGGSFDGCSGTPAPTPLPRGEGCVADADCVPMGCEQLRCIASMCTRVADFADADGDGHAPPPCGMDCDDEDRRVRPDATELCDFVDQDCDGSVDEDALPDLITHALTTSDSTMSGTSWPGGLLVTDVRSITTIGTRRISPSGEVRRVTQLVDEDASTVRATAALRTGSGAVLAFVREREILVVPVSVGADEGPVAGAVTRLAALGVVGVAPLAVALASVGSDVVAVWDEGDVRRAWLSASDTFVVVADESSVPHGPLAIASDGASVALAVGPSAVAFLDPASGTVGSPLVVGDLSRGRPLAYLGGTYLAFVRDAFDYSLVPFDETGPGPTPLRLPASATTGDELRVDALGGGRYLYTRGGEGTTEGLRAFVLDASFGLVRGLPNVSGVPTGAAVTGWIVTPEPPVAVLTNFGLEGATLGVLGCEE